MVAFVAMAGAGAEWLLWFMCVGYSYLKLTINHINNNKNATINLFVKFKDFSQVIYLMSIFRCAGELLLSNPVYANGAFPECCHDENDFVLFARLNGHNNSKVSFSATPSEFQLKQKKKTKQNRYKSKP